MPPTVSNRFGAPNMPGGFNHLQNLQGLPGHQTHHNNQQHHTPGTAGLPPPSFNSHHTFGQGTPASNIGAFAPSSNGAIAAGFGGTNALNGQGQGLGSAAAVNGFLHGAAIQQQQARDALRRTSGARTGAKGGIKERIRDVWRDNLQQEMKTLRELVDKYPYISMDTEFPGIVARPMGAFTTKADYHYQTLRCNVDLLSIIQVGITVFSPEGELPPAHPNKDQHNSANNSFPIAPPSSIPTPCTWQFNFQFSTQEDMYNSESIEFLANAGLNLDEHARNGIDPHDFGVLLITSGLVMEPDVRWISFHSGYDFGYLVKIMWAQSLPEDETQYRELLRKFFPSIYDIKYMVKHAQRTQSINDGPLSPSAANILANMAAKSGLQDWANDLDIKRIGNAHQAGSDSLLTGKIFWAIRERIFGGQEIDDERYLGQVWGLNGVGNGAAGTGGGSGTAGAATHFASNHNGEEGINGAGMGQQHPQQQQQYIPPSTPAGSHAQPAGMTTPQQHGQGGHPTPGGGGFMGRFQYR